eukprot:jgi/Chrzof1/9778/Cz04g15130.t1
MRSLVLHSHTCFSHCRRHTPPPPCYHGPNIRLVAAKKSKRLHLAADAAKVQTEEERIKEARQEVTRRIKALGGQRKVKEAIQELAGLSKLGIQPDTQAATALVAACTQANMEVAQNVFDELFGDFLSPDEVTFAVLLRGYGAADPPAWTKMDAVLTNMRMKYGIVPTATSYNALLEVCIRSNDLDRGMDVIDRMDVDGVEPDEFTEAIVSKKRALRSYFKKQLGY